MKITLIKDYKIGTVTKKKGLNLEVINEKAEELINKGFAVKFGEVIIDNKEKVKKKLKVIEKSNDEKSEKLNENN
jgi:hypothetical protein